MDPGSELCAGAVFVDVYVGQAMQWDQDSAGGDKRAFMAALETNMRILGEKHERPEFE